MRSVPLESPIAKEWLSTISSYPASPSSSHCAQSQFYEDSSSSQQGPIEKLGEELPEIGDEEEKEMKVFEVIRGEHLFLYTA